MRTRREIPGGLISFLDVMCCGFGAVVLLVVLLNGRVITERAQQSADLRDELTRATTLEELAREELAQTSGEVAAVERQQSALTTKADGLEARVRDVAGKARAEEMRARSLEASVAALRAQSAAVERAVSALRTKASAQWDGGKKPIGFSGDGRQQYLTGLKLGGERTLILLDSSASMLDETVVNVIRWKLTDPETRRTAPKWQRAQRTVHWLIANLRPDKQFQIYHFNVNATPLIAGSDGKWLGTNDAARMSAAVVAARNLVPNGGTSLHRAFAVIGRLEPKPDSVIVVTDGLPTQGAGPAGGGLVSAEDRLTLFADAIRGLPRDIPVNTLLFPMEGDPAAAGAFWQLAILTRGSFITPSRDWP